LIRLAIIAIALALATTARAADVSCIAPWNVQRFTEDALEGVAYVPDALRRELLERYERYVSRLRARNQPACRDGRLFGEIGSGDAARVEDLARDSPLASLIIASRGGNVAEATAIGRGGA
jgi:hypothetical protein